MPEKPNPGVGDTIEVRMWSPHRDEESWVKAEVMARENTEYAPRVRYRLANTLIEHWMSLHPSQRGCWRWPKNS